MDAQGALDSFLGRLTTVLVNEAQLLGRVRSDVEFIKDEMESMNSLILNLTEAQHRDHQVREWMNKVVGLTRDCEGNVELYIHYVASSSRPGDDGGLLGYLRRILRFLRTIPVRHRIASRIQELKVRARDIGDRRQRYGVTVPASSSTGAHMNSGDVEPSGEDHQDLCRRALLLDAAGFLYDELAVRRGVDTLVKCLSAEPAATAHDGGAGAPPPQVTVFFILGCGSAQEVVDKVYQKVYQDPSVSTKFACKTWSDADHESHIGDYLADILEQIRGDVQQSGHEEEVCSDDDEDQEKQLITKIQGHLKGKRFLIALTGWFHTEEHKRLLDSLLHAADGCLAGSAIIMTTYYRHMALSCNPYKIIDARRRSSYPWEFPRVDYYVDKARDLLLHADQSYYVDLWHPDLSCIRDINALLLSSSTFAAKTFLHLLYVNPKRTEDELQNHKKALSECKRLNTSMDKQVLLWCYNELPSKYRSCLLYLTVFPQDHVIRSTSLARRWVAESLITGTASDGEQSVMDEAEHYIEVLFIRGFVSPMEISAAGNIKSCTIHQQVREFITNMARDVNFVDTDQPAHLAHRLSIHNRIGMQKTHSDGGSSEGIVAYIPFLAASPQWQLLKVLDLEGCKGLKKKHMKSICKILLLKYLSLRNTDVAELPKQIKELQCLQTLDIRQTKVRMLSKKAIVLPLLKIFLAGHKIYERNGTRTSGESFQAVELPLGIHKMKNVEILSHVIVTDSDNQLASIAELLKLRKLGVALHGKNAKLSDLFLQVEKLHGCLRSLSIRIDPPGGRETQDAGMVDPLPSIPQFIERLNIRGMTGGLCHLIQEQHKLTKVTICETLLKEDDLTILGKLVALHCLRLQHNSYTRTDEIVFRGEDFQRLNYLLVEGEGITKISFASGAAPKLERIVWSFARLDALSGFKHLHKLKKLELNGDCDLDLFREELVFHPNNPILKHEPHHQHKEDRSAAPTSLSSAP